MSRPVEIETPILEIPHKDNVDLVAILPPLVAPSSIPAYVSLPPSRRLCALTILDNPSLYFQPGCPVHPPADLRLLPLALFWHLVHPLHSVVSVQPEHLLLHGRWPAIRCAHRGSGLEGLGYVCGSGHLRRSGKSTFRRRGICVTELLCGIRVGCHTLRSSATSS